MAAAGPDPSGPSASSRRPSDGAAPGAPGPKDRSLVAVVWCRQVDNEAESPGYTTVPTEFVGRSETLDVVRIVGNLAVNASDTHDYWDPDPSSKLAYYHNLFLYPAMKGAYLCLGRMFLSTEDRPRLGMKTLVLDTQALLRDANPGGTLRRWYNSMGNPARGAGREGRADPALVEILSEAFLYDRGDPSTPVLALAADNFHDTVESVLDLLEQVPAVLLALSGILVFPYFLPTPRVNVPEFTEKFPLTLAVFRIPRNEAGGDRHQRRVQAWMEQPLHLIDLTQGVTAELAAAPAAPLPVPWWKSPDRSPQSADLRRGIDRVELPRLGVADAATKSSALGGAATREDLYRIGRSIIAVAEVISRPLLQRQGLAPATLETARPYLSAMQPGGGSVLPPVAPTPPETVAPEAATAAPGASPSVPSEGAEPPWRKSPRLRTERAEVVPGPRVAPGGAVPPGAERAAPAAPAAGRPLPPSAWPVPDRVPTLRAAPPPAAALPQAAGPPPAAGPAGYPAPLLDELRAYVDQRVAERTHRGELEPDVVGKLERELERRLDARAELLVSPEAIDARIVEALSRRPAPPPGISEEDRRSIAQAVDALITQRLAAYQASSGKGAKATAEVPTGKIDERVIELVAGTGPDKRLAMQIDQRVQRYVSASVADERRATNDRLDRILQELKVRAEAQKEIETSIRSEVKFLDEKLQTLMGRLIPLLKRTWLKIDELEKRPVGGTAASDQKMRKLREELWSEMKRLEVDLSERTRIILDRVEGNIQNQGRLWLTLVRQLSSLTEERKELQRIVDESREDGETELELESGPTGGRPGRPSDPNDPAQLLEGLDDVTRMPSRTEGSGARARADPSEGDGRRARSSAGASSKN